MAGTLTDPIQSFSITEDVQFYENGKAKLYLFNISVSAKIVASQTLSTENKKAFILARQTAIMTQFKDYSNASAKYFEVQPRDGTAPFKFLPRVKSINFKEDVWVDFCDYTIEMEADEIYIGKADGSSLKVPSGILDPSDVDESWSTEYNQEDLRLTKVNHKISAKSKSVGAKSGWEISKTEVLKKIDALIPTDIQTASRTTYATPCNKLISYNVNPNSGEFSAEINLVYHNSTIFNSELDQDAYAYHEQTVTDKSTTESLRESLSIEGTITGLNATSNGNRFTAADVLWGTVKAALDLKYLTLTILSFSETKDLEKGIITYNYEIENMTRPTGTAFKSESISVTLFNPKAKSLKNYVIHNTIYGTSGPIFQDIKTKKVRAMSVTIERIGTEATPDTLTGYEPEGSVIESDSINFTAQNKKISRTTTFIWADDSIKDFPTTPTVNFAVLKTAIPRPY